MFFLKDDFSVGHGRSLSLESLEKSDINCLSGRKQDISTQSAGPPPIAGREKPRGS